MTVRIAVWLTALLGIVFYAGYYVGQNTSSPSQTGWVAPQRATSQIQSETDTPHNWFINLDENSPEAQSTLAQSDDSLDDGLQSTLDETNIDSQLEWDDPNDIVSMFNQLLDLSSPQTDEDMRLFSQAIDQFRASLSDSPTQLAIMMDYLQGLEFGSKEYHYVTSIMQGLPDGQGRAALENLALQISGNTDSASRQQFLHLVSNSYASADNPEIIASLVDIAIYSEESMDTKLSALDNMMPFQISDVERQQILSGLDGMIEQSNVDEKSALLNHVLRFSNRDQRQELAMTYISDQNDVQLRYSVLDGIHSGNIPRTDALKEQLFSIASNPSDPLHQQAKHALMYTFDITNQEYQRLQP
ncbi:hypothetical protein KJ365_13665 [Glaciecola sp. XM2]|uniref:hypothetical protein n=1 Tax=Glaciecola sp. XM2 TaxID=1914931 RepID=UPI001BDDF163|nr:hypothetical protein [Glaciecola sp. XM2]MBT1451935.1 hypothetical protein [Glaciecola sp. XM2]